MVGNGVGAKHGILFKTAVSLEEAGKVQIVALDKTGTITCGEPKVTDILPAENVTEQELLTLALALEQKSEHPLAKAILQYGEEQQLTASAVSDFQALPGNGLTGVLNGSKLCGGNYQCVAAVAAVPDEMQQQARTLAESGKTPLFFSRDNQLLGIIAVADVLKEESPEAIRQLQHMGIQVSCSPATTNRPPRRSVSRLA